MYPWIMVSSPFRQVKFDLNDGQDLVCHAQSLQYVTGRFSVSMRTWEWMSGWRQDLQRSGSSVHREAGILYALQLPKPWDASDASVHPHGLHNTTVLESFSRVFVNWRRLSGCESLALQRSSAARKSDRMEVTPLIPLPSLNIPKVQHPEQEEWIF